MNTDRRAILSLIAMGRITPQEAERLLVVSSGRDEATVRLVLLLAVVWLLVPHAQQVIAGLSNVMAHAMEMFVLWTSAVGRHAVASAVDLWTGIGGGRL